MQSTNHRLITKRLAYLFGFIILTFICINLLILNATVSISETTRARNVHQVIVSNTVLQATISVMKIDRYFDDLILIDNSEMIKGTIDSIQQNERRVFQYLDLIIKNISDDEGQKLTMEISNRLSAWQPLSKEIESQFLIGEKQKALAIIQGKSADDLTEIEQKMSHLSIYAKERDRFFRDESEKISSSIVIESAVLMSTALVFSTLFIFFMLKRTYAIEKKLEESRQLLINAMDNAPIGMILIDLNGTYHQVNPAFCKLTGYTEDELNQMVFSEITKEEDKANGLEIFNKLMSGQIKNAAFEKSYIHKDGTAINAFITASLLYDENKKPIFYFAQVQDITQRVKSEAKRRELESQLQQAQKLESIGRLAGGVAHDFNNMLTVIIGYSELSLTRIVKEDPMHDELEKIYKAAMRSADITRQLLAFSRQQAIVPKVLNPNEIIESMLKMIRRIIGENINLVWKPSPDVWNLKLDPSQLDQILMNLCVNSRDAISDGGIITIETNNLYIDEEYCSNNAGFTQGEYVQIAVTDDGCGMPKEILDQIYEPFFTTKSAGEGTGLGLATVYGIVKQNQGFINVYSEPGEGTTFRIYLSRYSGKNHKTKSDKKLQMPSGNGQTILLVEDDASILKLGTLILQSLEYNVHPALSPDEALKLAVVHKETIDLLITDVIMPGMNGRELSDQIGRICTNIKTIFMSGYTANVFNQQGIIEEDVLFISKPFSKQQLAEIVEQALNPDL